MRSISPALALVLLSGGVILYEADLFTVTLQNGSVFYWTSFDTDLTYLGHTYTSQAPWIERSRWNVVNTMEVPTMTVILRALNSGFNGGASIKSQIHLGLLDGASFRLDRLFMPTPGDTSLGVVNLFQGIVGAIKLTGGNAEITVKGKVNLLDRPAPRNTYQPGCIHTFCDPNCTLLRASFTTSHAVGAGSTRTFIPWALAPGSESRFILGSVTFTSGALSGEARTIRFADATGITLAYPLTAAPTAGDTFDAFEGCDKTKTRCTALSNVQHWRSFPYVPQVESAY